MPPPTSRRLGRDRFLPGTASTRPGLPPGRAAQLSDEAKIRDPSEVKEADNRGELDETDAAEVEAPFARRLEVELTPPPLTRRRLKRHPFPPDTAPTQPGWPPGSAAQLPDEAETREPNEVKETT